MCEEILKGLKDIWVVVVGFVLFGFVFGILIVQIGFVWWWVFIFLVVIYVGLMEFFVISMVIGGMSVIILLVIVFMVNFCYIFYGFMFLWDNIKSFLGCVYFIYVFMDEFYVIVFVKLCDE